LREDLTVTWLRRRRRRLLRFAPTGCPVVLATNAALNAHAAGEHDTVLLARARRVSDVVVAEREEVREKQMGKWVQAATFIADGGCCEMSCTSRAELFPWLLPVGRAAILRFEPRLTSTACK
jgi:hypothetical protein